MESSRLQAEFRRDAVQRELAYLNHVQERRAGGLDEIEHARMTSLEEELDQMSKSSSGFQPECSGSGAPQATAAAPAPMSTAATAPPPAEPPTGP